MASNTKGVTLNIGGTTVSEIVSLSGPNQIKETIDVTTVADTQKKYLYTILDDGEVTIETLDAATAIEARLKANQGTGQTCSINYGGGAVTFKAFVTGYTPTASGPSARVSHAITLKCTD
jgi:hypothetical protein